MERRSTQLNVPSFVKVREKIQRAPRINSRYTAQNKHTVICKRYSPLTLSRMQIRLFMHGSEIKPKRLTQFLSAACCFPNCSVKMVPSEIKASRVA